MVMFVHAIRCKVDEIYLFSVLDFCLYFVSLDNFGEMGMKFISLIVDTVNNWYATFNFVIFFCFFFRMVIDKKFMTTFKLHQNNINRENLQENVLFE